MDKIRINKFLLAIRFVCVVMLLSAFMPQPTKAAGTCGTGSWTSGNLEIHHINIGQADSTLIVGPTGKSLLFDAGESNWNSSAKAQIVGPYIQGVLGCTLLDYVVVSHFHADHLGYVGYGGLWHLVETQGFTVGNTLVRDYNTYLGNTSSTFTNWKTYLEGDGLATLHPVTAVEGTGQVDLGAGVTFKIVAVDGNGSILAGDFHEDTSPPSENDYSIGAVISFGDFDEWIGGDLDGQYEIGAFGYTYHDVELSVAPEVGDVDVYKANHHASSHSSSATFINQLDPEVSIVTVGDGNTYGHPTQAVMDRLLATSTVYMTQRGDTGTDIGAAIVAGHIVIKTSDGSSYTINDTSFTATEPTRTDADSDGYFVEADPDDGSSGAVPAPNGGCGPIYQTCSASCQVTAGDVFINEVLPSPSSGPEWVELYNTTAGTVNIGYCYIDDIAAGSAAYQIPVSTLIPPYGFWTLDRTNYFNNTGDDVRLLKEDASTVLDSYSYGNTGSDLSWYRLPDGGTWAGSSTASPTRGYSNTPPGFPRVLSIVRGLPDPTGASSVTFIVTFSEDVAGVGPGDFTLYIGAGIVAPSITGVTGSNSIRTVTVNTGTGNGTLGLNVAAGATITDLEGNPLVHQSFAPDEEYTIEKTLVLLTPANGEVLLHRRPTFDWLDVPDATSYKIVVSKNNTFSTLLWKVDTTNSTYTPPTDLPAGKVIYWRVRARVGGVWSAWSETWSFTTPKSPSIPVLVAPVHKAVTRNYTPLLDWNNSTIPSGGAAFNHYRIQISTDKTFPGLPLVDAVTPTGSRNASFYTPTTELSPNQRYYWRVQAVNVAGEYSSWSTVWTFFTALPPPSNLTPNSEEIVGNRRPVLDWDTVNGASGYTVQISTSNSFGTLLVNTTVTVDTFTPSTKLPANTMIYWRVRATGTNGPSRWTTASFRTP